MAQARQQNRHGVTAETALTAALTDMTAHPERSV
ncbi:hypothetical protein KIPB_017154, partial [Kipferlia bialata]|eukprot:g17154.t1